MYEPGPGPGGTFSSSTLLMLVAAFASYETIMDTYRAAVADGVMQRFGFGSLRIYYGSFDDWRANNGPVEQVNLDVDYDVVADDN